MVSSVMDAREATAVLIQALARTPPEDPLARRDPRAIEAAMALFGPLVDAWFPTEVQGFEHVPDGPALLVSTHNGGVMVPDTIALMLAGWRHFGPELPCYGLGHDLAMSWPLVGRALALAGAVPANPSLAATLLSRGARVLVYPGGDVDTFKPMRERHVVKFAGRAGFARLAIRAGVPIVPVVSLGAHETFAVLTDGRELARKLGLKRFLRIEVMPLFLCLPWGVGVGPFELHLPLPSRLLLRVLPPLRFDLPPSAADDEATVQAVAEQVRSHMQSALDEMAHLPGYGVAARLGELAARL